MTLTLTLAKGDGVQLSAPYGNFTTDRADRIWIEDDHTPIVLLSAGVGITPVLSMLSSVKASARPITWLHSAVSGEQHAFRDHLIQVAPEP